MSSSPTKPPSLPSRSSSQLSLDSHLSSPRKRYEKSSSSSSRPSNDRNGTKQPSSYPVEESSSSSYSTTNRRHSGEFPFPHEDHPPHLRMSSGFASLHVGIGSPKLDFGRRDWQGSNSKRKEGSSSSEPSPEVRQEERIHQQQELEEQDQRKNLVDRVSGLPSPPGTNSDIAPSGKDNEPNGEKEEKIHSPDKQNAIFPSKSPSKLSRRTSSTGSAHLIPRKSSSHSGSSTHVPDSPRLRTHALRPKHSPSLSMSRSGSSSSSLITSPSMAANGSSTGSARRGSTGISRTSSHSSSLSLGGNPNASSSSSRRPLPPLDLKRANSPEERISSPERTAKKLPPVSSGIENMNLNERKHSRRSSRDLRDEPVEEEPTQESSSMSRSKSQGSELDDKIREAEERIAQAAVHRRRRSIDVEKNSTPSRQQIRRHDSYTRATGSPLVASSSSGLRRTTTLSSAQTDSPSGSSVRRSNEAYDTPEKMDEDKDRSGGSNSSRVRKGLPAEFRTNNNLFTPSPQKPKYTAVEDQPGSSRSARLRQFLDSPSDYHSSSPIPSRFSTASRRSGELETVPSPSKGFRHIDGLERSSSLGGPRGETSGYSRRNWSQSISGLPQASDELDHRGLPRDRYRSETVLGGPSDRSIYQSRNGEDRGTGRRGMSTLVSERDLLAASRSRVGALGPGDSVSAVGARSDRGEGKDPLDMIRKLEEQRAESKRRWDHMPRSTTSMSSMREVYNNPPNTAPIEGLRHRRSIDEHSPLSPPFIRGGASRLGFRAGGPSTEPRPVRSSTSLGGRSSANLDFTTATTEHGRLLFEAFRVLESKLGQEILSIQPELLRTFHSATRTSESINTALRNAIHLATQIAVDAELDDPAKVREEYSNLAFILRDIGKASEQNVRDMTRIMLDLPKLVRGQSNINGTGSGMTSSTSGGGGRLRRSESASLNYDPIKQGIMSEDRARRWQPTSTSPINQFDKSPLQGRWSMDTPRKSYDRLRSSTSMADAHSPLSKYTREKDINGKTSDNGNNNTFNGGRAGSTVSSLMSKVRSMTPRKSFQSPSKLDLSTIQQSPPPPPNKISASNSLRSISSRSPDKSFTSSWSPIRSHSPEKEREKGEKSIRNMLRKKTSTLSTNTIKGTPSTFLPTSSGVKPTTAISQITAGDLSPEPTGSGSSNQHNLNGRYSIGDDKLIDEPNSPMSRFSFHSQRSFQQQQKRKLSINKGKSQSQAQVGAKEQEHGHSRNGSSDTFGTSNRSFTPEEDPEELLGEDDEQAEGGGRSYEYDPISRLEQTLVENSRLNDKNHNYDKDNKSGSSERDRERERDGQDLNKRPSISDRFRASLRKG